jgi:hypothetical protein
VTRQEGRYDDRDRDRDREAETEETQAGTERDRE